MPKTGAEYADSWTKRDFDVAASLGIMVVTSPAAALAALEAKIEYGSTTYIRERVGKDGELFRCYKFMSLPESPEDEEAGPTLYGAEHPEVSRVGRVIRNGAVDEWPQLINVLKGDINLVGIRTELEEAIREQELDHGDLFDEWYGRYKLNPGVTGEGQLYSKWFPQHTRAVLRRRMLIDIKAFDKGSLRNDVRTVARTPMTLLRAALLGPPPASSETVLMPEIEPVAPSPEKVLEEA